MKKKKNILLIIGVMVFIFTFYISTNANESSVIVREVLDATLDVRDNGVQYEKREVVIDISDIAPGKRVTGLEACDRAMDCDDESNWTLLPDYVNPYTGSIGNHSAITAWIQLDKDKNWYLRVATTDFEPMTVSYAKYTPTTTNASEYRDVYSDNNVSKKSNYEAEFTNVITGYKGGDIVLPSSCTANGCLVKFTFTKANYDLLKARNDDYNTNHKGQGETKELFALSSMFNHLETIPAQSAMILTNNNNVVIDDDGTNVSIYITINKFFNENNRTDFVLGDNHNRILGEDYLGINYTVDSHYFDEADGFLTFTEFNNYQQATTLFYGTPEINLIKDIQKPVLLADGGNADGMGTLKKVYDTIVSSNETRYPMTGNKLSINSFYEQEYNVPLILKNGSTIVQNITLTLNRYAFGGNAGSLLLVDGNGINCRRQDQNPDCTGSNIYVSTTYLGLFDVFYSTGTTAQISAFEISNQHNGLIGRILNNETVYERNEDFNPWAVAIYYDGDEVKFTKSFNLGELVKTGGFSKEVIPIDEVNGKYKLFDNTIINDYDSNNYEWYGYGVGKEISTNKIKYYDAGQYRNGRIDYTLILASKKEILDNNINRISLFLTNGELKSDENNFPKLTYGVGEGKIFELDGRTFEELGGAQ